METIKMIIPAIMASAITLLSACAGSDKKQEEVSTERSISDGEYAAIWARDSVETMYQTTLNEIGNDLIAIREKQNFVAKDPLKGSDRNVSKKEEILENIRMISEQLADNKAKINKLSDGIAWYKAEKKRTKKETEEL